MAVKSRLSRNGPNQSLLLQTAEFAIRRCKCRAFERELCKAHLATELKSLLVLPSKGALHFSWIEEQLIKATPRPHV